MGAKKPWGGRFAGGTNRSVEEFTASVSFDSVLYKYDIRGSIAHCRMLAKQKIIPAKEARMIIKALKEIETELDRGKLRLRTECEDIHMLIESRLIKKVGAVGGKLHTARSRNDQVALDINLYLRDAIADALQLLDRIRQVLVGVAEKNADVLLPGFTHLQHAQPVLLAHHLLAYFEMLGRDRSRLVSCYGRVNKMPLGAGALAGSPYPVDRRYVAELLGYPGVTANSMDTVSDRDGLIEFCSCAAMIMMHLSRFSEELILWSSPEFRFVEISDDFCTGSSIMPQKKNPDVPELVRGKTGRVYGNLVALLTLMKSLPLTYNRDLQEDKEPLFDTVSTTLSCLNIFSLMLPQVKINSRRMAEAARSGFLTATDLADYLARRGVPFRTAHEVVGRIVAYCVREGRYLWDLSLDELQRFSKDIKRDALKCLSLQSSVNSRDCAGGTGTRALRRALTKARAEISGDRKLMERIKR